MKRTAIWTACLGQKPRELPLADSFWVGENGPVDTTALEFQPSRDGVILVPTVPASGICGVLLVPNDSEKKAKLNGALLGPDLQLLRHTDRLEFGRHTVWIGVVSEADETHYEPAHHGESVLCVRTRGHLETGESIVLCPGTPDRDCGMIYKASAWSEEMPCQECGFDASAPHWEPQGSSEVKASPDVLQLVRTRYQREWAPSHACSGD